MRLARSVRETRRVNVIFARGKSAKAAFAGDAIYAVQFLGYTNEQVQWECLVGDVARF